MRYYKKEEIRWSYCAEIIALVIALLFLLEGYYSNRNIIILFGILIFYGHIRKIIYPHLNYYY